MPIQVEWNIYAFIVFILILALYFLKGRSQTISQRVKGSFPTLRLYSRDVTAQAERGELDPVIGREKEITRVIQILTRRTKNNPVLIGPSGVGKTAIIEGLAQAIVAKHVPELLQNKRVLALDLSGIVAGTKYRGEFEQRMKRIADEIIQNKDHIILFIDEIHTLAEAGDATGAIDADDILKPPLARGDLHVVGATTPIEYEKCIKPDTTLDRRLQPVMVREPNAAETVHILQGLRKRYEDHHHVKISDTVIRVAVQLARTHIRDRHFPDKAIDIIDEACAKAHIEATLGSSQSRRKNSILSVADVREVVGMMTEKI